MLRNTTLHYPPLLRRSHSSGPQPRGKPRVNSFGGAIIWQFGTRKLKGSLKRTLWGLQGRYEDFSGIVDI